MKINVEGLAPDNGYDDRGLVYSESRKRLYPSKMMFVKFLEQFKDIKADVDIWGLDDLTNNTVTINLELKYKVKDKRGRKK